MVYNFFFLKKKILFFNFLIGKIRHGIGKKRWLFSIVKDRKCPVRSHNTIPSSTTLCFKSISAEWNIPLLSIGLVRFHLKVAGFVHTLIDSVSKMS